MENFFYSKDGTAAQCPINQLKLLEMNYFTFLIIDEEEQNLLLKEFKRARNKHHQVSRPNFFWLNKI
jgi:hypothetical protein